jgi:hypothetical protein
MLTSEQTEWVATQLHRYKDDLKELYKWKLEKPLDKLRYVLPNSKWVNDLNDSKCDTFTKTLELRENLERELGNKSQTLKVAKWIINDWGGIPKSKDDTKLSECIAKRLPLSFDRIASFSKYLAFKSPTKHAIYDARVIYSLNWLLFKMPNRTERKYFPMPPGRNSVMGLLSYQIVLAFERYGREQLTSCVLNDIEERKLHPGRNSKLSGKLKKDMFVTEKDTYRVYCETIKSIASKVYVQEADGHRLTKAEMVLFSLADREIAQDVFQWYANHVHNWTY